MEELRDRLAKKKAQIACVMERTSEVRKMKDELQQSLSLVFMKLTSLYFSLEIFEYLFFL